ncbi:MAG: NADH:ubiquinone reductase (Na(+)-transporting) subunit C [Candidatus Neomarinimicrobiota bacterium]
MRSNSYTLGFTALVTIILGIMLSAAATSLKDRQRLNVELDIKKNILSAMNISSPAAKPGAADIQVLFDEKVRSLVVDREGSPVAGMLPENIDPKTMSGYFPVYEKIVDGEIAGYAVPISGKGLWSTCYGYLALEKDCRTIMGITFYQHGETPGLGGEIEKEWFTSNFIGKQIFDPQGELVSIQIVKGAVNPNSPEAYHQVDGISGATLTGKGLNIFIEQDLNDYLPFFKQAH